MQQLQREADAIGEIYGYFLARLKEAEVQQGTQQPDARLLSAAVLPRHASSPRVPLIILMGLMFGAMLGTGTVLLRELNKGGIRSATELQRRSGLPVLGQIPMAPIRRRNKLLPYLEGKNNTAFSEAIRNLRTSVLLSDPDKEPNVILLTSSVPAEGKTTTSIAMAHSLVGMGRSVLLVEGDVRKNTLGLYFEGKAGKIADEFPSTEQEVADNKVTIEELGIDVLFGARDKLNAADFFSSAKFKQFVAVARAKYDHVIIDAPPILPVTDARIIGQQVDAILYAVAWDETRGEVLDAGMSEFSNAGLKVTGLILTKIDGKKARSYGGSTRYGSYYGEYSAGYYS
nr:tyrosine-protein kinase domain-containing protein [Octadecabacter dasysiphoniae]